MSFRKYLEAKWKMSLIHLLELTRFQYRNEWANFGYVKRKFLHLKKIVNICKGGY